MRKSVEFNRRRRPAGSIEPTDRSVTFPLHAFIERRNLDFEFVGTAGRDMEERRFAGPLARGYGG